MAHDERKNWVYCRGDIYCAKLDPVVGSEQGGIRPVIVIQNDTGNKHAPTLIVATVTTRIHKESEYADALCYLRQSCIQRSVRCSAGTDSYH